jgi:hypothetical protein
MSRAVVKAKGKKSPRGRKAKLTQGSKERFLHAYHRKLPIHACCEYAGISESTYYNWLLRAKEGGEENREFLEFLEDVQEAGLKVQEKLLNEISRDPSWTAKAWSLKVRWPKTYGDQAIAKNGVPDEGEGKIKLVERTVEMMLPQHLINEIAAELIKHRGNAINTDRRDI